MPEAEKPQAPDRLGPALGLLALSALLLLAVSLLLDCVPRFHLGDSESYLMTRVGRWMPDDRSWIYGLFATAFVRSTRDLAVVPIWGVLVSFAAGFGFALFLARRYAMGSFVTLGLALVYVANPLEFFWSRSIMADSATVAVFVAFLAQLFGARRLSPGVVVGLLTLAFLLIGLRVVYFPPLLVALLAAAITGRLLTCRAGLGDANGCRDARRSAAGALILIAAYPAYAVVNTRLVHAPWVSANHASARFLLGAFSPALAPHIDQIPLPEPDRARLRPLTRGERLAHTFAHTGLVETLSRHAGSRFAAEPHYRAALSLAVRENPIGVLKLAFQSWLDYVNLPLLTHYHREGRFSGTTDYKQPSTLSEGLMARLKRLRVWQEPKPDLPRIPSPALSWLKVGGGVWSWALAVLASLGLLVAWGLRAWRDPFLLTVLVFSFVYFILVVMASNEVVTRYLLPQAVVAQTLVAVLIARRKARRAAGGDTPGPATVPAL